jgi:hypothetical protein
VTEQASMSLLPYQLQMMDRMDAGAAGELRDGRLVPANFELWDGTTIRRPSEAIAHLQELAESDPDNSKAWLRLGIFCDRFDQRERALQAWRRAVQVDEREVEAAYQLANALWDTDDPDDEAPEFALQALRRFPNGQITVEERDALAHQLVDMLRALVEGGDFPTELMAVSRRSKSGTVDISSVDLRRIDCWDRLAKMFAGGAFSQVRFGSDPPDTVGRLEEVIESNRPLPGDGRNSTSPSETRIGSHGSTKQQTYVKGEEEKVGRNDPCPCGSGRKYKKCCLRKQK